MKAIYAGTYEIATDLFRTRRTYQFRSLEDRNAFEQAAFEKLGAIRVGTGLDHVMTPLEALNELTNEKARCDDIAAGGYKRRA